MRELQLVGYTADLLHLVFTDVAGDGGRFKAPIDEDFVSTLSEVLELVDPDAAPLKALESAVMPAEAHEGSGNGATPPPPLRGAGPLAAMAVVRHTDEATENGESPGAERSRASKLAPREIQALLRAGQGPRAVAKLAETDEQWVRRWLPPIEAERDQILQGVWSSFVAKSRLGLSENPVGEAIELNLAAKGVSWDDPSVQWTVARREGDSYWQVVLRYRSRGRAQRASWRFDPETGALEARNALAVDIAWTRAQEDAAAETRKGRRTSGVSTRPSRAGRTAKRSGSKAATKKAAGKQVPAGETPATTKAGGHMAARKKAASKKAASKKAASKKAASKKAASKKAASRKAAGKKAASKKAAGKKAAGKKAASRKAAGKKAARKNAAGRKGSPRR